MTFLSDIGFEAAFNEAIRLRDESRYDEALAILAALARQGEKLAAVYGVMGGILLFNKGDVAGAIDCFRESTAHSPLSERASLGLFHSLWEAGDRDGAFAEMRRYTSQRQSDEYARILADLNESDASMAEV